jgi:UDP-N-acetylmuramoylalanine--D-glutamate ligase
MGSHVFLTDIMEEKDLRQALISLNGIDVELELGGHKIDTFLKADLIVISPGVPLSIEPLEMARKNGIPIIGEIELAFSFIDAPIIAITGTNGKTTTTYILGKMLERSGKDVFVGGNIGRPLIEIALMERKIEVVVAEISSFQLESISSFRPFIGILLNLAEDHLDRYPSYRHYCEAKARLFMNQNEGDFAILNRDDNDVMKLKMDIRAKVMTFGTGPISSSGATIVSNRLIYFPPSGREEEYEISRASIKGSHNMENIMAALIGARLCNSNPEAVQDTIDQLKGLDHRLEYVTSFKGVSYYNDSKATNVGAVIRALQAFSNPVILIAGGKDKGIEYKELKREVKKRVKALILIGEARERIARELDGTAPISFADSMKDAVRIASGLAEKGDSVLLSPACSSFDWYKNYEARGDDFKAEVFAMMREDKG